MNLKLLSCEVFYREVCALVARSPNRVDVEFLSKDMHDDAREMREGLQVALRQTAGQGYEAVLLAYGLCGNGIAGLRANDAPLVVPRAHDCITLFMGSTSRYVDYFENHPGVYFRTTGWLERGGNPGVINQLSLGSKIALPSYEELVARYGEDNAQYLMDELGDPAKHYRQMTFIETGVEPDSSFEQRARAEADRRGWEFEKLPGDLGLLQRLINGPWDESEFLVVPPGRAIAGCYDDQIIELEDDTPPE